MQAFQQDIGMNYSDNSSNHQNIYYSDEEQPQEQSQDNCLRNTEYQQRNQRAYQEQVPQICSESSSNESCNITLPREDFYQKKTIKCGCSKEFASFPSLYLHIRSAHNGHPPPNTSMQTQQIMDLSVSQVKYPPQDCQFKDYGAQAQKESCQGSNQQGSVKPKREEYSAYQWFMKSQPKPSGQEETKPICPVCDKTYSCKSALKKHFRQKHPDAVLSESSCLTTRKKSKMMSVDCIICGQTLPSNTALIIHIANWHGNRKYGRFAADGETSEREQDIVRERCTCGAVYQSRSALNLHMKRKHFKEEPKAKGIPNYQIAQRIINNGINPYQQLCGCGRIYSCRSSLNLHVRRKHNGVYPDGTTPAVGNLREITAQQEKIYLKSIEHFKEQRSEEEPAEESIYDSDNDNRPKIQERQSKREDKELREYQYKTYQSSVKCEQPQTKAESNPYTTCNQRPFKGYKPYKCGCGKTYTCSSSLNLHIKKSHNWVMPLGTICGPRGLMGAPNEESIIKQNHQIHEGQSPISCSDCGELTDNSYFKCKSCLNHVLCSICFWATNNFSKEHVWICMDR